MDRAFFWGCKIPGFAPAYATATRAVAAKVGQKIKELEFGCCGYPVRHQDRFAWLLSAARNFALADRAGVEMISPCKCCFGSLKTAAAALEADPEATARARELLAGEGLRYERPTPVRHLLQFLHQDVGPEALAELMSHGLSGLKVAVSYGCHALRPAVVTQFDNPLDPNIFEAVLAPAGIEPLDWRGRTVCCGNPIAERNPELSLKLRGQKTEAAQKAGAEVICLACTYCHLQYTLPGPGSMANLLLPQLLGLGLGLEPGQLGLAEDDPGLEAALKHLKAKQAA